MTPTTLTITAKGQVTLRRAVLEHLGAGPGDKLVVDLLPDGRAEVRAASGGSMDAFFGSLKRDGEAPVSIADVNEAIADGWASLP